MFVKHDGIVPPDIEFEGLHRRDDLRHVIRLADHAEREREHGILRVDIDHPVIAALVRIYDEVREIRHLVDIRISGRYGQ